MAQRKDSVNSSNKDGKCPLHIAAINNNVEMCKVRLTAVEDHSAVVNVSE